MTVGHVNTTPRAAEVQCPSGADHTMTRLEYTSHPPKKTVMLSLAATLVVGLSACGGPDQAAAPSGTSASVSTSANADVVFAQSMIPHHEQAVEMADLALAPNAGASAQVRDLARQIEGAGT